MSTRYKVKNVRTLLNEGFSDRELRRLCFDSFRPVYDQLAQNTGKADIIDELIEYVERKEQFDILLTWAEEHNPAKYKKYQPYIEQLLSPSLRPTENPQSSSDPRNNSPSFPPPKSPNPDRSKQKNINPVIYDQLDMLLNAGEWQKADQETLRVLLLIAERDKWLRTQDIEQFPDLALQTIDDLWKRYSNGRFGFSIQREIWYAIASQPDKFDTEDFEKFGDHVGWRMDGKWLRAYNDLTFTTDAPEGHLPSLRFPGFEKNDTHWLASWRDCLKDFLSRLEIITSQQASNL